MKIKLAKGNIPLFFQLYLSLKQDILFKEIETGDRLPTIEELAIKHGVANHTVRNALNLLKKDKLIDKKSKTGIVVLDHPIVSLKNRVENILDGQLLKELADGYPKKLSSKWIIPPLRIAAILWERPDYHKDETVFSTRVLLKSKVNPCEKRLTTIYIPSFAFKEFNTDSESFLKDYLTFPKKRKLHFKSELRPWICDVESADLLEIEDGTPVFHRRQIVSNAKGHVVFVSEGINTGSCLIEEHHS